MKKSTAFATDVMSPELCQPNARSEIETGIERPADWKAAFIWMMYEAKASGDPASLSKRGCEEMGYYLKKETRRYDIPHRPKLLQGQQWGCLSQPSIPCKSYSSTRGSTHLCDSIDSRDTLYQERVIGGEILPYWMDRECPDEWDDIDRCQLGRGNNI